jgi:hypothetical protein
MPLNRLLAESISYWPLLAFAIEVIRWLSSYQHAKDLEIPLAWPGRVLLARYNLLNLATYIYRAYVATQKAQPVKG